MLGKSWALTGLLEDMHLCYDGMPPRPCNIMKGDRPYLPGKSQQHAVYDQVHKGASRGQVVSKIALVIAVFTCFQDPETTHTKNPENFLILWIITKKAY